MNQIEFSSKDDSKLSSGWGARGARIDAHHHLWKFDPVRENWITEEMAAIKKNFLPQDFRDVLQRNGFDGSVVVQTDQSEHENEVLLNYSAENDFIKGVVGWIDLQSENLGEKLSAYAEITAMKGFRHILQGETNRAFMLKPAFMTGISLLSRFGFTYDILIFADQLKYIPEFVSSFPNQKFVIDHIAKPGIRAKEIDQWKKEMIEVGQHENVWCKISGMVTEADWSNWQGRDFIPYVDLIVEAFGTKRVMYGSDWPV
ncbi:MAG TPA: amidohydrolase family protein, partial [Chitinophagaceae bacterium]|nr:amidohydrolase family protein [Chitinophagaceae bacterium]